MKRFIFFLPLILTSAIGLAQPQMVWQQTFGGSMNDGFHNMIITPSGNFLLAGTSNSHDGDMSANPAAYYSLLLMEVDPDGAIIWQEFFDIGFTWPSVKSMAATDDGYFIVGTTQPLAVIGEGHHGGATDVYVLKIDLAGNLVWQRCIGGTGNDNGMEVIAIEGGKCIVSGDGNSNDYDMVGTPPSCSDEIFLTQLDADGNTDWIKFYGGPGVERLSDCLRMPDGGYLLFGYSQMNGGMVWGLQGFSDAWLLRTNATGDTLWTNAMGGSAMDLGYSIALTHDDHIVTLTQAHSGNGDVAFNHTPGYADYWLCKLDFSGNMIWQNSFGGILDQEPQTVRLTEDHGFLMTGITQNSNGDVSGFHGGNFDWWIVKADSFGALEWQRCVGGSDNDMCETIYSAEVAGSYYLSGAVSGSDGDAVFEHAPSEGWLLELGYPASLEQDFLQAAMSVYPNPSSGEFTISLDSDAEVRVIDASGKLVLQEYFKKGEHKFLLDAPEGVYFLYTTSNAGTTVSKLVKG